jgi:hypothetical protein
MFELAGYRVALLPLLITHRKSKFSRIGFHWGLAPRGELLNRREVRTFSSIAGHGNVHCCKPQHSAQRACTMYSGYQFREICKPFIMACYYRFREFFVGTSPLSYVSNAQRWLFIRFLLVAGFYL